MSVVVVTAGLSTPSSSRVLAEQLAHAAEQRLHTDVRIVELRELAHAITDNLLTGFPSPELQEAIEAVTGADGLIVVSPVFSASYSGLFKSFFDVLDKDALVGMPVLIAATGGTERHSLALEHAVRPLFAYLRAYVVPTAVYAATGDFGAHRGALAERIERASGEFADLVTRMPAHVARDDYDDVMSFDRLLAARTS